MKIIVPFQNHKDIILPTIKSTINKDVVFIGLNPKDKTENSINKKTIIFDKKIKNYSDTLNQAIQQINEEWFFLLYPGEEMPQLNETNYKTTGGIINTLHNGIISKETRIFKKNRKFINPIFFHLNPEDNDERFDVYIKTQPLKWEGTESILSEWEKQNPLNPDPIYYKCFDFLEKKDYKNFIKESKKFIFMKNGMASTMMKYYLSYVQLEKQGLIKECIENILMCISENPLMAEFWCLLGDAYFVQGDFGRAACFYQNAKILGNERNKTDLWPLQIEKYKKYPNMMLEKCTNTINKFNQSR